jgi:O-antigen biosynthesis protein
MKIVECVAFFSRLFFLAEQVSEKAWSIAGLKSHGVGQPQANGTRLRSLFLGQRSDAKGYLLCLDLEEAGVGFLDPDHIDIELVATIDDSARFSGPIGSVLESSKASQTVRDTLRDGTAAPFLPKIAADFISSKARMKPVALRAMQIQSRVCGNGAEAVEGWLVDVALFDLAIVTADFRAGAEREQISLFENRAVTAHLNAQGLANPIGDHHGFACVLPRFGKSSDLCFVRRSGSEFEFIGPVKQETEFNASKAIDVLLRRQGPIGLERVQTICRQLLLVAGSNTLGPVEPRILRSFGHANAPVISIVVAHYGSRFWFDAMLQMQRGFPDSIEFIHVCDDPAIRDDLIREFDARRELLSCKTILIESGANLGYAAANNLGVAYARAPVVILMNSDIWLEDPECLFEAASWIEQNPKDIVGFRLLFDDGSLQHDGIALVRSAEFGDLYLAQHAGKGLPPPKNDTGTDGFLKDVPATTGALLAISTANYKSLGGLDETFHWADFEDVDLCLRVRERGGQIKLMKTENVYHLEGQSMREGAAQSKRRASTLINAYIFNQRWADVLDEARDA